MEEGGGQLAQGGLAGGVIRQVRNGGLRCANPPYELEQFGNLTDPLRGPEPGVEFHFQYFRFLYVPL